MVKFFNLWRNHPGRYSFPCNDSLSKNQCAIRMSVALHLSNVNISSFNGVRCWEKHKDGFKHILRAQELADWMNVHTEIFGRAMKFERSKNPNMNKTYFTTYKGIIFIKDGSGSTDYIDVWNGSELKGGYADDYLSRGKEIWIWKLS